jgi:hypothetical protein
MKRSPLKQLEAYILCLKVSYNIEQCRPTITFPTMTVTSASLIDSLIAIKTRYEQELLETEVQAAHHRKQLAQVNSILLERILANPQAQLSVPSLEYLTPLPALPGYEPTKTAIAQPKRITPKVSKVSSRPISPPLLAPYQGLTKLDAIRKVLEEQGQSMHIDTLNQALYGTLNPQQLKTARPRLRTFLHRGVQRGLWQKEPETSNYFIGSTQRSQPQNNNNPRVEAAIIPKTITAPLITKLSPKKPNRKRRASATQISAAVKQPGKSKRRKVEVVALLKNANSLV